VSRGLTEALGTPLKTISRVEDLASDAYTELENTLDTLETALDALGELIVVQQAIEDWVAGIGTIDGVRVAAQDARPAVMAWTEAEVKLMRMRGTK
jgi:hypothetical protein